MNEDAVEGGSNMTAQEDTTAQRRSMLRALLEPLKPWGAAPGTTSIYEWSAPAAERLRAFVAVAPAMLGALEDVEAERDALKAEVERMRRGLVKARQAVRHLRKPSDEEWDEELDDPTGMVRHCEGELLPGIGNLIDGKEWDGRPAGEVDP